MNLKNIVDWGNEDLKKAMKEFNEIVEQLSAAEKRENKHEKELAELHAKAAEAKNKLDVYKDSSPVPLDSLYEIYVVMENIRGWQDNVDNY